MRVIAGIYKSRQLKTVQSNATRPTTDRNKENMFNIIGPYFEGGVVLDLFGGSGGLGVEAISRGCDFLYSIDKQYVAFKTIKENVEALQIENVEVWKLDYKKALHKLSEKNITLDLVLLDPPYGKKMIDDIFNYVIKNQMLNDGCLLLVEELKEERFKEITGLQQIKRYEYGISALTIFKYTKGESK